jgi:hypothetical protein
MHFYYLPWQKARDGICQQAKQSHPSVAESNQGRAIVFNMLPTKSRVSAAIYLYQDT